MLCLWWYYTVAIYLHIDDAEDSYNADKNNLFKFKYFKFVFYNFSNVPYSLVVYLITRSYIPPLARQIL